MSKLMEAAARADERVASWSPAKQAFAAKITGAKMPKRMTEEEWRDLEDLRNHWHAFCDCDPFNGSDTFIERMDARGYVRLRAVKKSDIQSDSFAAERGIAMGGSLWELTAKGEKSLRRHG